MTVAVAVNRLSRAGTRIVINSHALIFVRGMFTIDDAGTLYDVMCTPYGKAGKSADIIINAQ